MTPWYITGASCLIGLVGFFIGRAATVREYEEIINEMEADPRQRIDLR